MKGTPKRIATGKDLLNCLALVQAGEMPADDLSKHIEAIEQQEFVRLPIASLSEDRKTAIMAACPEITEGAAVEGVKSATISAAVKMTAQQFAAQRVAADSGKLEVADAGTAKAGKVATAAAPVVEEVPDGLPEQEYCTVTLSKALAEGETVLRVEASASPYDALGITKAEVSAIKEVLKNYE